MTWKEGWSKKLPTLTRFNNAAHRAYRVLRNMCKGNEHVGELVAEAYRNTITSQCRLLSHVNSVQWYIVDTLEEMFRGNEKLLRQVSADRGRYGKGEVGERWVRHKARDGQGQ